MPEYQLMQFQAADDAQTRQTRLGGQPDWVTQPQWPLSQELNTPMRFIGQINLGDFDPDLAGRMAFLFMTEDDDEYVDGTWEPEGGENAVIIQPSDAEPLVAVAAQSEGPSREAFTVESVARELPEDSLEGSQIGGAPRFMQYEEYPEPAEDWRFVAQLDSSSMPFEINFGDAGIAYVFVDTAGRRGRLLWQCG